jgi:hypothetical protein
MLEYMKLSSLGDLWVYELSRLRSGLRLLAQHCVAKCGAAAGATVTVLLVLVQTAGMRFVVGSYPKGLYWLRMFQGHSTCMDYSHYGSLCGLH